MLVMPFVITSQTSVMAIALTNFFSRSGKKSGGIRLNNVQQVVAGLTEDGVAIPGQPSEPKAERDAVFR